MEKLDSYFAHLRSLTPMQYAERDAKHIPHTTRQIRRRAAQVQASRNASSAKEYCYGYSLDGARQDAAAGCRASWFALMQDAAFLRTILAPGISSEILAEARRSVASARQNRTVYHKLAQCQ